MSEFSPVPRAVSRVASPLRLLPLPALLAATLVVGACRRPDGPSSATLPPAAELDARGHVTYPESDYTSPSPGRAGGTLLIAAGNDTPNLDPHGVSAAYIQWFGRLVFDCLIYLDASGRHQPWLAESWTVSPDGLVYTFKLREGVTFSDGSRFDAEAVRLNLEHMRDPATRSPLAARYIEPYAEGRVVDELTFEARMKYPYAPFLDVLAQSWLAMISPKQIVENPRAILYAPIGSGPFILETYERQRRLRFVRRPDYHWAPPYIRHEGPAYLERIEIEFLSENLLRYVGLSAGKYDLILDAPAQNARAIRGAKHLVLDRRIRKGIPSRGLTFNTKNPPFDDERVRRALVKAVDREGLVNIVGFGEFGHKSDLLGATTSFYDPSHRDILAYDPAEANRLLDEAGWTGRDAEGYRTREGVRLSGDFLANEASAPGNVVVACKGELKKVGFELRIVPLPAPQLLERRTEGRFHLIGGGVWHTNTPDALYINYHSDEIAKPGRPAQNSARLTDPAFDELVARARRVADPVELQDLYSRAQRRIVELAPAIPLYENYTVIAYNTRLRGLLYDTSHNTPLFTAAWRAGK